ncbi:MAG: hypothetical protein GY760_09010 [Deltaproteobacteria bacterium]|nr:hypothetical protein [Deltaproteobacteria bacterium]
MEISGNQRVNPLANQYKRDPVKTTEKEANEIITKEKEEVKSNNIDSIKGNNIDIEV